MKKLLILSSLALSAQVLAAGKAQQLSPDGQLKIELHPNGEFAVAAYPRTAEALVRLTDIQTFNLGSLLAEACEKMPARIKMLKSRFLSEASKATYREGLLNLNQIRLSVQGPRWLQDGALEKDVFQAVDLDSVVHWNPLQVKDPELVFNIDPSASSLEVESADALAKRLQAFKNVLPGAVSPLALSSVPLVCDLQAGRIQVLWNLTGEYRDFEDFRWPEVEETEESAAYPEPRPNIRHGIHLPLKWQD